MVHLIDKDALEAKIDGEIKLLEPYLGACAGQIVAEANSKIAAYNRVKDILNTLDVKVVGLEKVFDEEYSKYSIDAEDLNYTFPVCIADFREFAKHFFELGLKVVQKGK